MQKKKNFIKSAKEMAFILCNTSDSNGARPPGAQCGQKKPFAADTQRRAYVFHSRPHPKPAPRSAAGAARQIRAGMGFQIIKSFVDEAINYAKSIKVDKRNLDN